MNEFELVTITIALLMTPFVPKTVESTQALTILMRGAKPESYTLGSMQGWIFLLP